MENVCSITWDYEADAYRFIMRLAPRLVELAQNAPFHRNRLHLGKIVIRDRVHIQLGVIIYSSPLLVSNRFQADGDERTSGHTAFSDRTPL